MPRIEFVARFGAFLLCCLLLDNWSRVTRNKFADVLSREPRGFPDFEVL